MDYASLFNEIIRFEIELWNLVESRLLAEHQIPLTWYEPMQVINTIENCRVQNIAAALSITVGGVSKLIDRIEANGLCQRRPDPLDGRSAIIALTDKGKRKLAAATQTFVAEIEASVDSSTSMEQLAQFQSVIGKWRTAIISRNSKNSIRSHDTKDR